jgi:HlyD family secretion protein
MLQIHLRSTVLLQLALIPLTVAWAPIASSQSAQRVSVIRPGRADLIESVSLVGTLEPTASADVVPRVTGYLGSVSVDVGDRVRRGDILAQVDAPDLTAALSRAEAQSRATEAGVSQAQAGLADAKAARDEGTADVSVARAILSSRHHQAEMAAILEGVQEKETQRTRRLVEQGAATAEQLEASEGALASAQAARSMADSEVDIAQARIGAAEARAAAASASVTSAQVGVDAAGALVEAARAAAAEVRTRVGFCQLVCPYDEAVVTGRHLHPGAHVLANQSMVLTLMDTRVLRVVLPVTEGDSVRIAVGQRVQLIFRVPGVEPLEASLSRISGALDRSTRTVRAEVDLNNSAGSLRPGMFCNAEIELRSIPGAIVLPGGAVHTRSGSDGEPETYVWVAQGGTAAQVVVTLGLDDGIVTEIQEGLSGSEAIISAGLSGLRDGAAIEVVEGDSK